MFLQCQDFGILIGSLGSAITFPLFSFKSNTADTERFLRKMKRILDDKIPSTYGENMIRRTVTIDPKLDQIINLVRGLLLIIGQEYNYTEVVNGAIYYGICYWLNIPKQKAVEMASQVLTTNLKIEGIRDELRDKVFNTVLSKIQLSSE